MGFFNEYYQIETAFYENLDYVLASKLGPNLVAHKLLK